MFIEILFQHRKNFFYDRAHLNSSVRVRVTVRVRVRVRVRVSVGVNLNSSVGSVEGHTRINGSRHILEAIAYSDNGEEWGGNVR